MGRLKAIFDWLFGQHKTIESVLRSFHQTIHDLETLIQAETHNHADALEREYQARQDCQKCVSKISQARTVQDNLRQIVGEE